MNESFPLAPGEGEEIRPGYHIKAAREELVMTESRYAPGMRGPEAHVHYHHADGFYVLEGELLLGLGDGELSLAAGGFVLIPPVVVHSFRNAGTDEVRFLNFHAPGMGFDGYVRGRNPGFDQHDPPADGGRPASEAIVRRPGEGERQGALGSLGLIELTVPAGSNGPGLHSHDSLLDSFWVLEGTVTLQLEARAVEAHAGSYGLAPPGRDHAFSNPGDAPARLLNVMAGAVNSEHFRHNMS
jgi:mannose-6-phosphate isomerase-like protein (cupin superfamily)